jgi:hypothetical protein
MGAWDGYYSLGGTEIANEERFRSYIQNVAPWLPMPDRSLANYEGLHRALGDPVYTNPTDDRAPWVDLDDPVTSDFLGFTVLSVEGLENSTTGASSTESLGKGGNIGLSRDSTREIRVTGLLVGKTPEAVQQGFTWLHKVLWQKRNPRQLVPQMPGTSDFRFFAQRPEVTETVINRVLNPDATYMGESLVGSNGTAYAFRALSESGNWAYKMVARTAGDAEVQLIPQQRALAVPGSMWVARVDVARASTQSGQRYLNVMLRFRDQYGNIIQSVGKDDTSVPEGVLYRWTGTRFDSTSQMLTPNGMLTNFIVNPRAEGANSIGLYRYPGNKTTIALQNTSIMSGKRAYLITAGGLGTQSVSSQVVPTMGGEQWWGRAVGKQTNSIVGARHYRADLEWLDGNNKRIGVTPGTQVDLVPSGTVRQWTGRRMNSVSQEITGDAVRYNRNPNPIPRGNLTGYSLAGNGGGSLALERFTGLGTPYAIRVNTGTGSAQAHGLNIPSKALVGETIYVTFWIIGGESTMRLQGDGFTFVNSPGTAPSAGLPFSVNTSVPNRISIPIKITKATQIIRVIANDKSATRKFRITRIGLLTGSDSYFDGDTGTYEWEGIPYKSSSIAHLPGNYDLFNVSWNPGFEKDTFRWSAGTSMTAGWSKSTQRLGLTVNQARASGNVLAQQQSWPQFAPGQRTAAGMTVYNNSSTAFNVATRAVSDGGTVVDGTTTTIPANGSAWAPLPTFAIPSGAGNTGWSLMLVAKGAIAAGTSIHIDNTFFGSLPAGGTPTQAMWFDGATPKTNPQFYYSTNFFNLQVGGVAPEGAEGVRLMFARLNQGPVGVKDQYLFDEVMLAQYDAVDTTPDDPSSTPTPTMPAFFDGDFPSTYQTIPTYPIDSSDSTTDNAVITAEAPEGAVTAEIAVQRVGQQGAPAVGDVFYLDNVLLADYDPDAGDPPEYTEFTRHDVIAETERWVQEVGAIAGPTVIQDIELDCEGAAAQVEFTLVAENPTWLRDNSDTIAISRPTEVTVGGTGLGTFAKIEDRTGIVKNFMPQFSISSALIPNGWVVGATAGAVTASGVLPNSAALYALSMKSNTNGASAVATISAINVLGARGGADSGTASVWIGGTAGTSAVVQVQTFNGGTVVQTYSQTVSLATSTDGNILSAGYRVDFNLGSIPTVDGFKFVITGPSSNTATTFIANPQVTLGSAVFPPINGNLPDDGTYTYDFDAAGFSRRTPVMQVQSHTIFTNLTAPPTPVTGLGGYDEVGLTTYRTYAAIPAEIVPRNADAVPVVRVDFEAYITRWVRFRFYPNPQNLSPDMIPTGSYTAEWVIDLTYGHISGYSTAGVGYTSIVIDGVARRVWLRAQDGTVIPGDQFVMTSEGSPIDWPEFRDVPYVVSVEYPTFRQANEPSGESWWRASMALMIEE